MGNGKIILIGGHIPSRDTSEVVKGMFDIDSSCKITFKITGQTQLPLKNGGAYSCVVAYLTGFVMTGGYGKNGPHGKVDRCSTHHCQHNYPLSAPGTTLKANTWIPFQTWPHQDISAAAPVFSPTTSR